MQHYPVFAWLEHLCGWFVIVATTWLLTWRQDKQHERMARQTDRLILDNSKRLDNILDQLERLV